MKKIIIVALLFIMTAFFIWSGQRTPTATISVMSFNIENGGTQIDFNKVVEAIKKAQADLVGLQEPWGHAGQLASALGWKYYNNQQHIISRYPLLEVTNSHGTYLLAEIKPGYAVAIANVHLPSDPYGPDLIKQGASKKTVIATEHKLRLPTLKLFVEKLAILAKQGVPVFLTGDFNSPSHLDWRHQPDAIAWPVTTTIEENGLTDAYRNIHPTTDAATWPAMRPEAINSFDGFNPSSSDLPTRIDMIFTGGKSTVLAANIVGEASYPFADIIVSPWPSDHRAVVARFKVTPAALSKFKLITPSSHTTSGTPQISTNKKLFHPGEPIIIHWRNLPGNRFDYIMIIPIGSKKLGWSEAVRLYTYAKQNGSMTYNQQTAKGNWLAWQQGEEGHWPMKPGKYTLRLMLDDSLTEIGRTEITII